MSGSRLEGFRYAEVTGARHRVLMDNFSPAQYDRFEAYRRHALPKQAVRKVRVSLCGTMFGATQRGGQVIQQATGQQVSQPVAQIVAGFSKVFVGEIVEKGARFPVYALLSCRAELAHDSEAGAGAPRRGWPAFAGSSEGGVPDVPGRDGAGRLRATGQVQTSLRTVNIFLFRSDVLLDLQWTDLCMFSVKYETIDGYVSLCHWTSTLTW